jgi:hypothetical protein
VVAGLLLALALATPAAARTVVDPATLNPAPPDSFNPVCYQNGSHITCTLSFTEPTNVDEPTDIFCNGTELLATDTRSVVGKRVYDADGNLLRRHFRESITGSFLNPDTGRTVLWRQHDTVIHNLAVPGDLSTGTTQTSGLDARIWSPDGGTVLIDAGHLIIDPATDEVLKASGPHPFNDYYGGDPTALAAMCAALA